MDVWDHDLVNRYVTREERPIPFSNIIYLGDGETDIPCFRLVKDQGGHSIAVYKSDNQSSKENAERLIIEGRVNFSTIADYSVGSDVEKLIKKIILNVLKI